MEIGNVNCNVSACADDVALMSRREHETQVMINIAHEFATMEWVRSLFRQPIIPTAHCSDGPLFRQPIAPTAHFSDNPLFRQ